jgi:hypothetical protein
MSAIWRNRPNVHLSTRQGTAATHSKLEMYRAHADYCCRMSRKMFTSQERAAWQNLADRWFQLLSTMNEDIEFARERRSGSFARPGSVPRPHA